MNAKKRIVPINTTKDGLAQTIIAGYYKFGAKNLLDWNGTTGTCVMEIYENGQDNTIREHLPNTK